jgi:penicillin-binding protein 2
MNHSDALSNNLPRWRLYFLLGAVVLVFSIYVGRLILLQVIENDSWSVQAADNSTDEINLPAPRGIIYDRNGTILARNIASYNVGITPANLPDDEGEIQQIYRNLSDLLKMPVNNLSVVKDDPNYAPYVACQSDHGIAQIVEYGDTTHPYEPVKIKCDIPQDLAMTIEEKAVDWPGVSIEVNPVRDYPTGELTADFIGYLGPISAANKDYYVGKGFQVDRDKVGYAGLEYTYQDELAGENGKRVVEKDVAGKVLGDVQAVKEPVPGKSLQLTIDTRLQVAAENILIDEINYWNRRFSNIQTAQMTSGVVIAMNPKTGEILAMVSYPTYENNRMARFIPSYYYKQLEADKRNPLLNHAVGDELPTGSVFKLATAVGALNEGIIKPDTTLTLPGRIYIEEKASANDPGRQREFVDWNYRTGGFGKLDFLRCIANSSNVCFYKIGGGYGDEIPNGGLGICRIGTYAKALGYGDYPGTGLPDEADGLVPDPTWKRETQGQSWTLGDTYIVAVGQGYVLSTPLEVLMSAATIANDGKLMQPTLVRDILDGEGNVIQPFEPKMKWDLTADSRIHVYEPDLSINGCEDTGQLKTVQPWVFKSVQEGMRLAVLEGTLKEKFDPNIAFAGKTGTAEYCDEFAKAAGNPCDYGSWPTHAWTLSFAPYENPEIAVVAFVYNGGEGASTTAPIVSRVMNAYFALKAADNAQVK